MSGNPNSPPRPSAPSEAASASTSASSEVADHTEDLPVSLMSRPSAGMISIERDSEFVKTLRWRLPDFKKIKGGEKWSGVFQAGRGNGRLLLTTKDTPRMVSIFLVLEIPQFCSFRVRLLNSEEDKTIVKDCWMRFRPDMEKFGWPCFIRAKDVHWKSGFLEGDALTLVAEMSIMEENLKSFEDTVMTTELQSGGFSWEVKNFEEFLEKLKSSQWITSPVIVVANSRFSMRIRINPPDFCVSLEKEDGTTTADFWCLGQITLSIGGYTVRNQFEGRLGEDECRLCAKLSEFQDVGFAKFGTWFSVVPDVGVIAVKRSDWLRINWTIEDFKKVRDLFRKMKAKRQVGSMHIKSKFLKLHNLGFKVVVYPRGMFPASPYVAVLLEATNSSNGTADWSIFLRVSVVNQNVKEASVTKEAHTRFSGTHGVKELSEFMTLTDLFDREKGFLVEDRVQLSVDILPLKESTEMKNPASFTWKVERFESLKEILERQHLFLSKVFHVGGWEVHIGFYQRSDYVVCVYLESEHLSDVRWQITLMNQQNHANSVSLITGVKTRNCSHNEGVLTINLSDLLRGGFLVQDTIVFECQLV